eukprot:1366068-Amorphochlora_amoeboformis.AAC.2
MKAMENDTKWCNLQNLKKLLNEGLITKTEYSVRKKQLIDELTGKYLETGTRTSLTTLAASQYKRRRGSSESNMGKQTEDMLFVEKYSITWITNLMLRAFFPSVSLDYLNNPRPVRKLRKITHDNQLPISRQ